MIVTRLTTPDDILKHWPFFREGLKVIKAFSGETSQEDAYFKMLLNLAENTDNVWIGIVFHCGCPLGYGVATDCTPPFADRRTFTVCSFYHIPGQFEATKTLMIEFEKWARENGVQAYNVTTRRSSGPAIRCFTSGQYGFRKSYMAFEKRL